MSQHLVSEYDRYRREALLWSGFFLLLLPVLLFIVPEFQLFPEDRRGDSVVLHLLVELFALGVSVLVAATAWHTLDRAQLASANLVVFGFCIVAGLGLGHALTDTGMPAFFLTPSPSLSIFFRLAACFATVFTLAAIALGWQLPGWRSLWLLAALLIVVLVGAFGATGLQSLPALSAPGQGVSPFKVRLEYLLCGLHLLVAALAWHQARRRDRPWLLLLAAAALISGVGELMFATPVRPTDFKNIAGHLFKVCAFVLLYRAIYLTALKSPYAQLEQVQRRLSDQESILRAMINSIPFEVWVRDADGRVVVENPAVVAHWGSLLGTTESDPSLATDVRQRWLRKRASAFAGEVISEEIQHAVNGEPRDFHNLLAPVINDGRIVGTVGLNIDITERKQAERETLRLTQELEQRVQARTRELRLANAELEEFSASVSHDLQAPLRNIAGYLTLLLEGSALDTEQRHNLDVIARETARAQQLIADLLNLARVGRTEIQRSAVDLNKLVTEVIDSLTSQADTRPVVWHVDPLPTVPVDRGLFRQVFVNLLGNALKFSAGQDPARISIRLSASAGQPLERVICIRDNGVGFDMQQVDRLFHAFRRLHSESEFPGTGIGLVNVKRVVEHHGGRVWAEGRPGEGSSFYVAIPLMTLDLADPL